MLNTSNTCGTVMSANYTHALVAPRTVILAALEVTSIKDPLDALAGMPRIISFFTLFDI